MPAISRITSVCVSIEPQRSERVALCAIVAIALVLRFFRLAHQSLWVDEILSYKAFVSVAGVPYWKKFLYDVHGPLYSLFMHFWSAVSKSDFWLRTPSAIAGALAVYALFRWFVEIGRRDLALPAALFLALSPFHIYYSQELRFYAFLSLFAVLALIAFERFRAAPTARSGALLGVAFACACLSHFSALFLGAAFFVYLVFSGRLRGAHLRFGGAGRRDRARHDFPLDLSRDLVSAADTRRRTSRRSPSRSGCGGSSP